MRAFRELASELPGLWTEIATREHVAFRTFCMSRCRVTVERQQTQRNSFFGQLSHLPQMGHAPRNGSVQTSWKARGRCSNAPHAFNSVE
ncbi:hypothetical protein SCHPADRAFT_729191 [Schizopora paradoxa]|uniref:Uncharacterized protein n=1 Tax=Schizopora paradoxa TaxID=27342 RepID=A0A0H2RKN7_9AGAM|nr:hypothetical protein SCHPADRAFT_729191 [Schizopora paradoxa]